MYSGRAPQPVGPRQRLCLLGRLPVGLDTPAPAWQRCRSPFHDQGHGLAGVRLWYLVAAPDVIAAVRELQPAWSVNSIAQAAGLSALADEDHVAAGRKVVQEAKAYLRCELGALGIPVNPSVTNFLLARVGDARKVRNALLRERIAVRDCTSFGLPHYIRIATRRPEECSTLVEALKEVMAS